MNNEELHMSQIEQTRHDLLIRLDEQTKAIARDVQEIKNGYGAKIALLDENKMNKSEFTTLALDLKSLQQWRWYTAGGLAVVIAVLLPILAWSLSQITSLDQKVEKSVSAGVAKAISQYEVRIETKN